MKLEVGDKVKVVACKTNHAFIIGDIVTLVKLETNSGHKFADGDGNSWWMDADEYYPIRETATGTLAEIGAQVGDVVEWVSEDETIVVAEIPKERGVYNDHYKVMYDGGDYGLIDPKLGDFRIVSRASDLSKLDYKAINVEKPIYEIEPDTRPLEHFQSGPVITETTKRIVPGVYGRLHIQLDPYDSNCIRVGFANRLGEVSEKFPSHGFSRDDLIAARDVFNQLIDAMPHSS